MKSSLTEGMLNVALEVSQSIPSSVPGYCRRMPLTADTRDASRLAAELHVLWRRLGIDRWTYGAEQLNLQ
jgi:hypothetical protein